MKKNQNRLAVIDYNRCEPSSCGSLVPACIKNCPIYPKKPSVIKIWKKIGKPIINMDVCIDCGICANVCYNLGFQAIKFVNLPNPEGAGIPLIHSYGENSYRLFGLPYVQKGSVIGLLGQNGIGKSTLLNILAGDLRPNGGDSEAPVPIETVIEQISNSSAREHLTKVIEGKITVSYKRQVLKDLQTEKRTVKEILKDNQERVSVSDAVEQFSLQNLLERQPRQLSGGELQRTALALSYLRDAEVYLVDEPCTYLDIKQRLLLNDVFQELAQENRAVLVAEHDTAVLDFFSDFVHIIYGEPHAYGIVSKVAYTTKKGINNFLKGELADENVRFRSKRITFTRQVKDREWNSVPYFDYPEVKVRRKGFELTVLGGRFYKRAVVAIMGENGLGKTTFANYLFKKKVIPSLSYKPQLLRRDFDGTVEKFLAAYSHRYPREKNFKHYLLKPLGIVHLLDRTLEELSGGELQRVYIAGCLGRKADVYIIDEGSAFLDVEERLKMTRVIRHHASKESAAIIAIEHDIQIADAISDQIMVFEGEPGKHGYSRGPLPKRDGMNHFLKLLGITFRRDPETGRARINKPHSRLDREQREIGEYFFTHSKN